MAAAVTPRWRFLENAFFTTGGARRSAPEST